MTTITNSNSELLELARSRVTKGEFQNVVNVALCIAESGGSVSEYIGFLKANPGNASVTPKNINVSLFNYRGSMAVGERIREFTRASSIIYRHSIPIAEASKEVLAEINEVSAIENYQQYFFFGVSDDEVAMQTVTNDQVIELTFPTRALHDSDYRASMITNLYRVDGFGEIKFSKVTELKESVKPQPLETEKPHIAAENAKDDDDKVKNLATFFIVVGSVAMLLLSGAVTKFIMEAAR